MATSQEKNVLDILFRDGAIPTVEELKSVEDTDFIGYLLPVLIEKAFVVRDYPLLGHLFNVPSMVGPVRYLLDDLLARAYGSSWTRESSMGDVKLKLLAEAASEDRARIIEAYEAFYALFVEREEEAVLTWEEALQLGLRTSNGRNAGQVLARRFNERVARRFIDGSERWDIADVPTEALAPLAQLVTTEEEAKRILSRKRTNSIIREKLGYVTEKGVYDDLARLDDRDGFRAAFEAYAKNTAIGSILTPLQELTGVPKPGRPSAQEVAELKEDRKNKKLAAYYVRTEELELLSYETSLKSKRAALARAQAREADGSATDPFAVTELAGEVGAIEAFVLFKTRLAWLEERTAA